MTIKKYFGIRYGSEIPHRELYGKLVKDMGGHEKFIWLIPATKEKIREALSEDEHLNNIPLSHWDSKVPMVARVMKNAIGINSVSIAECVCVLKEAAKQWAEDDEKCGA